MNQNRAFFELRFKKIWASRVKRQSQNHKEISDHRSLSRRRFLQQVQDISVYSVLGFGVSSYLTSCAFLGENEVRIGKISEWDTKKFLTAELNEATIFVSKDEGNKLYALDLTCTHKQCTVRYKEEINGFKCPCHKGIFDIMGKVLEGRPPRDLAKLKVELRGDEVWAVKI